METDAFISYSSQNALVADALKHHLEASGIRCFKAPDSILPGQVWEDAIAKAITKSRSMILVWSSQSQVSDQVKRELNLAINASKIIIPYKIDDAEPAGSFAYYLTNRQRLDAANKDAKDAMTSLASKLLLLLEIPSPNTATSTKTIVSVEELFSDSGTAKTSSSHQGMVKPSLLQNELGILIDRFNDADDWIFRAYPEFEDNTSATRKALVNHGLQHYDIDSIYLFLNISHFRSKNGILICNYMLSVKDFWEKPVHFEFCGTGGGLLEVEAKVDAGPKLVLAIKRLHVGKDGEDISRLVRIFELNNLDKRFLLDCNKKLVEEELPKLVRTLGLIQQQRNHEPVDA